MLIVLNKDVLKPSLSLTCISIILLPASKALLLDLFRARFPVLSPVLHGSYSPAPPPLTLPAFCLHPLPPSYFHAWQQTSPSSLPQPSVFLPSFFLVVLLLSLSGLGDTVACVCGADIDDYDGTLVQCEVCSRWSHCPCVNISVSLAETYPFVCLHE